MSRTAPVVRQRVATALSRERSWPCLGFGTAICLLVLAGCAEQQPIEWPWEQAQAEAPPRVAPAPPPSNAPEAVVGQGAVSVGPKQLEGSADGAQAASVVPAPPPPDPKPETPPQQDSEQLAEAAANHDPRVLIGLDFDQASRLLGDPALREEKPPAKLWLFTGSSCSMRVFFYPTLGDTTYRVLTYEVDGESAPKPAANNDPETSAFARRCFGELLAQRDTRTGQ